MTRRKQDITLAQALRIVNRAAKKKEKELETKCRIENKKLIGNCYKYRNSFSGDESWWLYLQIIDYKSGCLVYNTVEKTTLGIEIEKQNKVVSTTVGFDSDYIPITEEEYFRETSKIIREMGLGGWHHEGIKRSNK